MGASDFAPALAQVATTSPVTVSVASSYTPAYGGTLASASSVSVVAGNTYLLTGTTTVTTLSSVSAGLPVTLIASGQAAGLCVVLTHLGGNMKLRDSASLGLYVGESMTLVYDGTYWVEIARDIRQVLDYQQITSSASFSATTEATATAIITSSTITFDGATPVIFELFSPEIRPVASGSTFCVLYDGAGSIGKIGYITDPAAGAMDVAYLGRRRITPSNASHTYSWRAYTTSGTVSIIGEAGGSGAAMPAYMRISRDV